MVQLQLRAEEIQSQRQELELIRQRMVKLTGDGKTAGTLEVLAEQLVSVHHGALSSCLVLSCPGGSSRCITLLFNNSAFPQDVENVLEEELRAPEEWRRELSRERSRLRAYYIRASQEVAESLVQLIVSISLSFTALLHSSKPPILQSLCTNNDMSMCGLLATVGAK